MTGWIIVIAIVAVLVIIVLPAVVSAKKMHVDYAMKDGFQVKEFAYTQEELKRHSSFASDFMQYVAEPERVEIPCEGMTLVGYLFNQGVSKDLIVYNYMWNGHYGPASERHEAQHMAAAFSDKQVLFLNQPGFGGSSGMTETCANQLALTGNYGYLGDLIGPGLNDYLSRQFGHIETLVVYGQSQGALRVSGYVRYLTEVADKVHVCLVDPPGTKKHSLLGLALNYVIKEGMHTIGYRKHADAIDPVSAEKRRESAKLSNYSKDKVFRKKGEVKPKRYDIMSVKSLCHQAIEKNLRNMSAAGINCVRLYILEKTAISNNRVFWATQKKLDDEGFHISIRHIMGVSHAFTKAKPVLEEMMIRQMFDY